MSFLQCQHDFDQFSRVWSTFCDKVSRITVVLHTCIGVFSGFACSNAIHRPRHPHTTLYSTPALCLWLNPTWGFTWLN